MKLHTSRPDNPQRSLCGVNMVPGFALAGAESCKRCSKITQTPEPAPAQTPEAPATSGQVKTGFWDCCQNRPAKAVLFYGDDGAPVWYAACAGDAATVAGSEPWRVAPLPDGFGEDRAQRARVALIAAQHGSQGAARPGVDGPVRFRARNGKRKPSAHRR